MQTTRQNSDVLISSMLANRKLRFETYEFGSRISSLYMKKGCQSDRKIYLEFRFSDPLVFAWGDALDSSHLTVSWS